MITSEYFESIPSTSLSWQSSLANVVFPQPGGADSTTIDTPSLNSFIFNSPMATCNPTGFTRDSGTAHETSRPSIVPFEPEPLRPLTSNRISLVSLAICAGITVWKNWLIDLSNSMSLSVYFGLLQQWYQRIFEHSRTSVSPFLITSINFSISSFLRSNSSSNCLISSKIGMLDSRVSCICFNLVLNTRAFCATFSITFSSSPNTAPPSNSAAIFTVSLQHRQFFFFFSRTSSALNVEFCKMQMQTWTKTEKNMTNVSWPCNLQIKKGIAEAVKEIPCLILVDIDLLTLLYGLAMKLEVRLFVLTLYDKQGKKKEKKNGIKDRVICRKFFSQGICLQIFLMENRYYH